MVKAGLKFRTLGLNSGHVKQRLQIGCWLRRVSLIRCLVLGDNEYILAVAEET